MEEPNDPEAPLVMEELPPAEPADTASAPEAFDWEAEMKR